MHQYCVNRTHPSTLRLAAPSVLSSLLDISRFVRGTSFSLQQLADNEGQGFWRLKAPEAATGFQVPIFFVTGEHDRVTPAALVEKYESELHAPIKQSIIIKNTGHFAFFTDPQKFSTALLDIRNRTYPQQASSSTAQQQVLGDVAAPLGVRRDTL